MNKQQLQLPLDEGKAWYLYRSVSKSLFHGAVYFLFSCVGPLCVLFTEIPFWGKILLLAFSFLSFLMLCVQMRPMLKKEYLLRVTQEGVSDFPGHFVPWNEISQFGIAKEEYYLLKFADDTPRVVIEVDGRYVRDQELWALYEILAAFLSKYYPDVYLSKYENPLEKYRNAKNQKKGKNT